MKNREIDKIIHNNKVICILHIINILLLGIIYPIICKKYSYMAINFTLDIMPLRIVTSIVMLCYILHLSTKIKHDTIYFIYNSIVVLIFYGEIVQYALNSYSNPISIFGVLVLLTILVLTQNIKIKIKKIKINKNPMRIILILAVLLFIPFIILYGNRININNLFLNDIYETRLSFRNESYEALNYLMSPLSRVVLPVLIALSIKNKKYGYAIICSGMILFIFLCGAVKSILFGLIAILFFYRGDYKEKIFKLLAALCIALSIGSVVNCFANNSEIINYSRRLFFVPSRLNTYYADYFQDKPTYLSHSSLGFGLEENEYGDLSRYFGEEVIGSPGLNANVGIITEGYVSFNIIGTIIFAIIAVAILNYFKQLEMEPYYCGVIFIYIYYINTSFLSTLLITHGLLFLILFAALFMRKREEK